MTQLEESRTPHLEGDAAAAVKHRGSPVQIIAAAGSGKTEVVSQRVADLLASGEPARSIVAFTFTEKAAAELKNRIAVRVEERLGPEALDQLGGLYVGTIHAFCFRLLQSYVPRYETFDVLDDNQLTAFLSREANLLELKELDSKKRLFASIKAFLKSLDVIENELLEPGQMPQPFRSVLERYFQTLERYRLLTYGQQIVRAVRELEKPEVAEAVHGELRHLIVDEYQDVNLAQERLIELLAGPNVELCVVGDDDQAIYQWRGSDVDNIVTFADRYPNVAKFEITTNRRSRPQIIETANRFAVTIPNRIEKSMDTFRAATGSEPQVILWTAEDEESEAGWIANMILDLNESGVPFREIAILVRSRAAYPKLLQSFATFSIPVQPGGRTGLFDQPEARVVGRTVCWLTGLDWRDLYGPPEQLTLDGLLQEYGSAFGLDPGQRHRLGNVLKEWKREASREDRPADLLAEMYTLLDALEVRAWDLDDPIQLNRVGTLARFSTLLADYESVRRRARPDANSPGEQVGGQDRGTWYYKFLGIHIINYAQGAYEGFDGEPDLMVDAVDISTVHRAKGLEWPVVFVPSLTKKRFPSSRTGNPQDWLVPPDLFAAERYEGSDGDERRLFYVALTRARDFASVSRHERVTSKQTPPSPYFEELSDLEQDPDDVVFPTIDVVGGSPDEQVTLSFSELAQFLDCGRAYRLRTLLGFQPRLAPELGYGKAVHHVLRAVAERTRAAGSAPTMSEVDEILHDDFFLPTANKPAHKQMKAAARRLVSDYIDHHESDLYRIWETERPFELHLDGITVNGRADVILDQEGGVPTSLAILDYKTSTDADSDHGFQLQVYVDAGRREGLDVPAAYVHDLKASDRQIIPVTDADIQTAEETVREAGDQLRRREYNANPGKRCKRCDVRSVCADAQ